MALPNPTKPGRNVDPEFLKAAVRSEFGTVEAMAERYGVSAITLRASLRRPLPRANEVVASHFGVPKNRIWPEWYDRSDRRIFRRNDAIATRKTDQRQKTENPSQKGSAA